jgi:uncharacterized Fe-S cluster-containing radical SAM superfamily enzyme
MMTKEINLSELFPIRAEIEGNKITIQLHNIIVGELSLSQFKNSLKKKLILDQTELDVAVRGDQLVLEIGSPFGNVDEKGIANTAGQLISNLLYPTLRNQVTGNKLVYITKASGIPLIGRIDFGIIDRGTNLLQIRPITGCVLDCPFCSVDSGSRSKTRITDFIIDSDYLADEAKKLCEFKGSRSIELHIDGQGEPTLYPYLPALIKDLSVIRGVETISLQTNGAPLTEKLIDQLETAGLSRINLSLNSLDHNKACELSGNAGYSLSHILGIIEHIMSSQISLLIAPLWIPGFNDEEILGIIRFVKKLGIESKWPVLGLQNYLVHRHGRRMKGVRPESMKHFRWKLERIERTFGIFPLLLRHGDFHIVPMESYPKPFRKGEIAEIEILEAGRMAGEMLGVGRGRSLHVLTNEKDINRKTRVRIIRTKHNIFIGNPVGH